MAIKRIPFSPMTRSSRPCSLAGRWLGKIKFIYSISAFHTDSNEESMFLSSQPVTVSVPSSVLSVTYLRSQCLKCTLFTKEVSKLCIPRLHSVGSPSEVLSRAVIQNLNKLMKSWGERDTEQLSGLLAVHGWSVPFQERMWQCLQSCRVSPYCSFRG